MCRSSKTVGPAGLFVPTTGSSDNITYSIDDGTPLYYNVLNKMSLFTKHWDNLAKVPYLTGTGGLQTFVSYDDENSIGEKAQYIVDNNLRGAIIWEITGDYIETFSNSGVIAGTPLADTLNIVFCNTIPTSTSVSSIQSNKKLLKVTDLLGRETKQANQPLFYIYDDGTVEKKIILE